MPGLRSARGTRRYARGFSPIVGFWIPEFPDWGALLPFCAPQERIYCDGWSGAVAQGWQIAQEATMFKMLWNRRLPEHARAPDAVALGVEHAAQALELATITHPGPFGLRTLELGEYFGFFDGGRLIALAGERTAAGCSREISGVCTHPACRDRGFARRLTCKLVRRQLQRGSISFLHDMSDNTGARTLYEKMGVTDYRETVVRVVSLLPL